jgi:aminoglycoside phosphotransferase (APT) family kinase protein
MLDKTAPSITDQAREQADTLQLLRALRYDITHVLAPEVSSSMARMVAKMAEDVVTSLIRRANGADAAAAPYRAARANSLREALALDDKLHALSPPDRDVAEQALDLAAPQIDQALETVLTPLLVAAGSQADGLVRGLITATLAAEAKRATTATQDIAADAAMRKNVQATVTAERLQAYWRARFPNRPNARVTSLRELSGGFSKTTILFDVADWEDAPASLVMRRDVLGGATETSVVQEYPVLCAAHKHGLLVPEILFLEEDLTKLDRAFIVMRKAQGEPAGDLWRPSPACTPQTGIDLARTLAKLHALDPAEFGIGLQGSPEQQAREYLQSWRAAARRKAVEPDPVLEAALTWVEHNMPPLPARLSYVHADPGFWNILIQDGCLTALLDWELGHLGDPAEDLSYVKPFIEVFMPWQDFLAAYYEAGGGTYSEASGDYFAIWRDVRNAICSGFAANAFTTELNPELRMAHCGIVSYRLLLLRGAEKIAALGMKPNLS